MNSQQDAVALLADTHSIRDRTRASMQALWFPLVLFGLLSLASAGVSWRSGGEALGIFWLIAAPVGIVATSIYYRRSEHRIGLETPVLPAVVGVAVIIIGCFGTGFLGGALDAPRLSAAGPPLAISAGYLIFAWVNRRAWLAATAFALAALDVALVAAGASADTMATVLSAAYGTAFLVIGLVELVRRRSAP